MRRHRRSQHGGTALPAALVALVVAASFAAALADLARTEVILARYRQVAAAALAAADACLAAVVAAMPPGWDFDPLLAGPDGVTGTGDDGMLGAPAGCTATARRPPGAATPARVAVTVDANAAGGRRRLDAIIGRTRAPGVPAIVWLGGSPTAGAVRGTLDVDGSDAADPSAAPSAMVAAPSDPLTLDAWLAGEGAHVTTHSTSPPLTAPSPPFSGLLARLTAAGEVTTLPPAGTLPGGLARAHGDLVVDTPLSGAGLLFVDGVLDIRSSFDFTGVVVAVGGVRVQAGGSLTVAGAVWAGTGALTIDGVARLRASRTAVEGVDGLLPLPRRPVLLGVKDLA